MTHRDTPIQVDWLRSQVRIGDHVLAVAELAFLPSEWERVGASVQVAPGPRASVLLKRSTFDYVVSGDLDHSGGEEEIAQSFVLRASFGHVPTPQVPYFWRTNDERILIFARRD